MHVNDDPGHSSPRPLPEGADVTVVLNQFILGDDGGVLFACRGHNDLVGCVMMEGLRERCGTVCDGHVNVQVSSSRTQLRQDSPLYEAHLSCNFL